ncbi:hypothetical protein CH333_08700 [candidate division WOR-3 bacterium JGI_Cruoil_03_44_89]|uniref:FlgD/Vpr Ig-like domain-containing protein n=1 Tax=candidate division WOR-3 bacterium JGI_Cruoil_03_44_89 TaxID=1973748 RepID=A0A235BRM5_UNCW3|nr:MAG: hypothetical protein CH333_08700 [candidate division WOR-3 bacterium JGI_Cruoil_03_44_89]
MKRLLFSIFFLGAQVCFSDPIWVSIVNEFQTAPDSLERIELHWITDEFMEAEDIEGWWIETYEGIVYVDTSIILNDSNYVVIDASNTSGFFTLNDDEDIIVVGSDYWGEIETIQYPYYYVPAPPPGASASRDENELFIWYIDPTPTFGYSNDDIPIRIKINEFQTLPNSLQRIELKLVGGQPLMGWYVVTQAGTAYIDSDVVTQENGLIIIDTANTSGIFILGDTNDVIGVFDQYDRSVGGLSYPQRVPAPPCSMSTSLFEESGTIYYYLDIVTVTFTDWYISTVPTFGFPNDDYPGTVISGYVFDVDSQPLPQTQIRACLSCLEYHCTNFSYGGHFFIERTVYSDSFGFYLIDSLLPSNYHLYAEKEGYIGQDVRVSPTAMEPGMEDFYLEPQFGIEENTAIHGGYELNIYPNPLFKKTVISYRLSVDSDQPITLKIYDLSGRLIRTFTLHSSLIPPHEIIWDGRDDSGRELPGGVYFCRLEIEGGSKITKKVVLIR